MAAQTSSDMMLLLHGPCPSMIIPMRPFIRSILSSALIHRLLYAVIRIYSRTFQLNVVNETCWQELVGNGTPVLLCAWHQQFFGAIRYFKNYARYRPALMISQSRDGAIIAAVAQQSGWRAVRGSSSRGGKAALRTMINHLKSSGLAAHIVDGPTGPMGLVKAGAIHLAHGAGASIVPFWVACERAWFFNSWDRFMLPVPFSRVTLRFGDPIRLNPTDDPATFENQRRQLEAIMAPFLVSATP